MTVFIVGARVDIDTSSNQQHLAGITLRRATKADKQALFAFIRKAYPNDWRFRVPHRWEWLYESNPFTRDGQLPIWIALTEDGEIIAQTTAMMEPLCAGDNERTIGWASNAVTLPAFRKRGIGTALEELNASNQDVSARLGMPTEMCRIMKHLEADSIDHAANYWRLLSCEESYVESLLDRFLQRYGKRGERALRMARLLRINKLITLILKVTISFNSPELDSAQEKEVTIRELSRFGEETDTLWKRIGNCYEVIIRRNAEFCNWKYVHQPHLNYRCWFAWRDNEPRGYIVLRIAQRESLQLGIIADIFAHPDDELTVGALISFAVSHFEQQGMKMLSAATTIPVIARGLRKAGFAKIGKEIPMIYRPGEKQMAVRANEWFLGKSDCDWDASPLHEKMPRN